MTLLNTVANLGNTWPKSLSLYLVDALTVTGDTPPGGGNATATTATVDPANDGFYPLNQLCIAVGVVWLCAMTRSLLQLRELPASAWTVPAAAAAAAAGSKKKGKRQ